MRAWWDGRHEKMYENRMVKRVFESKLTGVGRVGRLHKRWLNSVRKILGLWSKQRRLFMTWGHKGVLSDSMLGALCLGMNPHFDEMPQHTAFTCYDVHWALNFVWLWAEGFKGALFWSLLSLVLMHTNPKFWSMAESI